MGEHYTSGEVLFLLALRHQDALLLDSSPPDSLVRFTHGESTGEGSADPELPVLARRWDVRRAQHTVGSMIVLRAAGVTERELATALGVSHVTIHHRIRATVDDILDQLGGEGDDAEAVSRPAMCLLCGIRPHAKTKPVLRRVRGGWKTTKKARQLNICADCATGGPVEDILDQPEEHAT